MRYRFARLAIVLLALVVGLLVGLLPNARAANVQAQEQVDAVPLLPPITSMRHQYVLTVNGQPGQVCEEQWESFNRSHGTCRDLMTLGENFLVEGWVGEYVYYDGVYYERVYENPLWTSYPLESYDPNLSINAGFFTWVTPGTPESSLARQVFSFGTTDVNGVPATHYQVWVQDEGFNQSQGGQVVYDIFLGADNLPLKDQYSVRSINPDDGSVTNEITRIWTFTDINAPITVSPPPAGIVRPSALGAPDLTGQGIGQMLGWQVGR